MEISQVSDSRPGWGRLLHLGNTGFRFLGLLGVGLYLHPPDLALKVFRRKRMLSFWKEGWGEGWRHTLEFVWIGKFCKTIL